MKITATYILIFICACTKVQAQMNYVLNSSFEQYTQCPLVWDQIKKAIFWSSTDTVSLDALCTPDYCNACAGNGGYVGIPSSVAYNHYPRTGNCMVEVMMYFDESFTGLPAYRDYLQGRLSKSLTNGINYCATFYVTLEQLSGYAINHIGAYIDDGSIDTGNDSVGCAAPRTAYTPQIVETTIINDTLNWVKIQGSFVANGTEKFITIGNFFDKAHTSTVHLPLSGSNYSWYLVDDVSVIESDAVADAGADKLIGNGDTVLIGLTDSNTEGMPCYWYVQGSTTPIDSGGSIRVHPDTTTSYVVEMDLCGNITKDTVSVFVAPEGTPVLNAERFQIYPNPTSGIFTIENAKGTTIVIYDVVGKEVYRANVGTNRQQIDISSLPNGVYMAHITNSTGNQVVKKIIKG